MILTRCTGCGGWFVADDPNDTERCGVCLATDHDPTDAEYQAWLAGVAA